MREVYIVGGLRTPIGKTNGVLKHFLPEMMTATLLNALINKYQIESTNIDEVILGNAVGTGGNLSRLTLLEAGWEVGIPATTIDFQCGSGLRAINIAASQIKSGTSELVVAGGLESTSFEPKRQYHERDPRFQGKDKFYKRAQFSPNGLGDPDMLEGAENTAGLLNISREGMDQWALESHKRAIITREQKRLNDIIVPLEDNNYLISEDESIRKNISMKLLERIKPVIKQDGRITCGNSCLTHDGAAVILLASEDAIKKYHLKPIAKITAMASSGVDPNYSPLGPIEATKKLLSQNEISLDTIDAFEINEAFAVKILAFIKAFNISTDRVNRWGGALAYGHPYGASGAIIMLHLIEILKYSNMKKGIASLGVAGGQGIATMIERCEK